MPDMDKGCQQLSEITDIQVNDIGDTDSTKGVVEWKKKKKNMLEGDEIAHPRQITTL